MHQKKMKADFSLSLKEELHCSKNDSPAETLGSIQEIKLLECIYEYINK